MKYGVAFKNRFTCIPFETGNGRYPKGKQVLVYAGNVPTFKCLQRLKPFESKYPIEPHGTLGSKKKGSSLRQNRIALLLKNHPISLVVF